MIKEEVNFSSIGKVALKISILRKKCLVYMLKPGKCQL